MILLDLLFWICDHWEEVTLNSVLLLLLRKFILSEVHKILYFNRDGEIEWMRKKLEGLTGEKWSGQLPIWKRVESRYIKKYSLFSLAALEQKRRKQIVAISRKLFMALFGAIIVVLNQQLGWSLDAESIYGAGSLIISYILGQSLVDTNGTGQFAPLLEKLKSKKLWAAVVGSIIIVLNDTFKWGMDANSIYMLAGTGVSFILGKSAISVVKAAGGNDVKPTINGSSDK